MLSAEQQAALSELRRIWPEARIVLIGAGALSLHRRLPRFTADLDLAVAVDLESYPGGLAASSAFRHDPVQQQRWTHGNGVPLDIIPAGAALCAQGYVLWPNDHRMSLEGFEALFSNPLPLVHDTLHIELASVSLIALLKMVAWLDRPGDRARDLHDLVFLFANYLDESNDADFDRILAAIQGEKVDHASAHALLLGKDVALHRGARRIAARFVALLEGQHRWRLADMQRRAPDSLRSDESFDAAWRCFVRGLGVRVAG